MQHDVIVQSVKRGQEICDVKVSFFGGFWSHSGGAGGHFILTNLHIATCRTATPSGKTVLHVGPLSLVLMEDFLPESSILAAY